MFATPQAAPAKLEQSDFVIYDQRMITISVGHVIVNMYHHKEGNKTAESARVMQYRALQVAARILLVGITMQPQ